MITEEIISLNTQTYDILKGYDKWEVELSEEKNFVFLTYNENSYLIVVNSDIENMPADLVVAAILNYPENINQPLEQINECNNKFDSVKIALWPDSQIVFSTCISLDFLPKDKLIQFVQWSISEIGEIIGKALDNHMLDCLED